MDDSPGSPCAPGAQPPLPGAFGSPTSRDSRDSDEEASARDLESGDGGGGSAVRCGALVPFSSAIVVPPPPTPERPPLPVGEEPVALPIEDIAPPSPTAARLSQQLAVRAQQSTSAASQCWARCTRCLPSVPRCDCWSWLQHVPVLYCRKLGQHPAAFITFYAIVLVVAIPAAWRGVTINTDLDAFRRVDAEAALHQEVYLEAMRGMRAVRNNVSLSDRTTFELEIFYEAKSSVLGEAAMGEIKAFERQLRNLPGWKRLCNFSDPGARFRCEPGESLANYMWPRRLNAFLNDEGFFRLKFDGSARERLPVPVTLAYLVESSAAPHDPWKFLPQGFDIKHAKSTFLRSTFMFTAPSLEDSEFTQHFHDFIANALFPELEKAFEESRLEPSGDTWERPRHTFIYFRGDALDDFEVSRVLQSDLRNAAGALVMALFICWFQLRSLFLAWVGAILLSLTVLLAYVIVPIPKLGLASFLAVFLIFGLGTHTLFRVHSSWRRSRSRVAAATLTERLLVVHTLVLLQMLPLVASALSFYVCMYSVLRPLREFGLFMGAGMLSTSLLCFLVFIPALVLHEQSVRPFLSQQLPRVPLTVLEPAVLHVPWKKVTRAVAAVGQRPGSRLRCVFAVSFGCLFIPVVAVAALREGTGLPELFSKGHNHNAVRSVASHFAPRRLADVDVPPNEVDFCEPGHQPPQLSDCGLHWCESPLAEEAANSSDCFCQRTQEYRDGESCQSLTVHGLMSGKAASVLPEAERLGIMKEYVSAEWGELGTPTSATNASEKRMPPLVMEHWESGSIDIEPLVSLPPLHIAPNKPIGIECVERAICHCSRRHCTLPGGLSTWTRIRTLQAERGLQSSLSSREGAEDTSKGQSGTEVTVIFGIMPPTSSRFLDGRPTWSFDHTFDPVSPWAQRAMYAACSGLPQELNVVEIKCWISDFRQWMLDQGEKFPVSRFDDFQMHARRYTAEHRAAAGDMWLDDNENIRATALHFKVGLRSGSAEVLEDQRRWRAFIAQKNSEASTTASRAWVTSQAWVDMEAYDKAIGSAWGVCLLSLLTVSVAGALYTLDFEIMGLLLIITFLVCTGLLFFMLAIFQWQFGPWELLIITIFTSHWLEPAFHIGLDFVNPAELPTSGAKDERPGDLDAAEAATFGTPVPMDFSSGSTGVDANERKDNTVACLNEENDKCNDNNTQTQGTVFPADLVSEASSGQPTEQDPTSALQRSVYLACDVVVASGVQLIVCGIMLLPCQFRLFSQLGAVAILVPLFWVPATLLLLPAMIQWTGRVRREPDFFIVWRFLEVAVASLCS